MTAALQVWFGAPERLVLLCLAPAVWWLLRERRRLTERRAAELLGERAALLSEHDPRRDRRRAALFGLALFFAALACAEPRFGAAARTSEPRGADIVVCLDVSLSMLAGDAAPNRLEASKAAIRALRDRAAGDRLALVVFAGDAVLASPLTRDGAAFGAILDAVDPWSVTRGGTDLSAAISAALAALAAGDGDHAAIILVSDGEDLGQAGLLAASSARARKVALHTVVAGSPRGAKILAPRPDGAPAPVRDPLGREVISTPDREGLRRIAATTEGSYADLDADPNAMISLYDERIRPVAGAAYAEGRPHERTPRFQWPLGLAIALFLADLGLSARRRR